MNDGHHRTFNFSKCQDSQSSTVMIDPLINPRQREQQHTISDYTTKLNVSKAVQVLPDQLKDSVCDHL